VASEVVAMAQVEERVDRPPEAENRLLSLFEAHHGRLYALARRLTATQSDAEDTVQDTFLRVARSSMRVPQESSEAEAWLVRVLVNVCRDRWRVQRGRRHLEAQYERPSWTPTPGNPEAALIAQTIIWKALSELPPRRRAVVVLHELDGLDISAIARMLGVSAVTIRWHLARGRRELARAIGQQVKGER